MKNEKSPVKIRQGRIKQVIIDRGVYHLGIQYASGEKTEPGWESTLEGRSLIIGHEDETFEISHVEDLDFIIEELNNRLKLNLPHKKFTCSKCDFEFYSDIRTFARPQICPCCEEKLSEEQHEEHHD